MQANYSGRSCAASAPGFAALWAVLVALGAMASSAEAAPFAYVTGSNTVSVIDTADNKVVATIPLDRSASQVAVSPDGTHAYVTTTTQQVDSGNVSVIDTATNRIAATIPIGASLFGIAVSPDGKKIYVANSNTFGNSNNVSVIDVVTKTVAATIPMGDAIGGFGAIAVSPDGKWAYVGNRSGNDESVIQVIDLPTNTVAATIQNQSVESSPFIAVAPDGKHVYAINKKFNRFGCSVSVIDTATKTVAALIIFVDTANCSPSGIAITPDGKHAYVPYATLDQSQIAVIATADNTIETSTPMPQNPVDFFSIKPPGVAITPDGKYVHVMSDSSVLVLDTATNAVVATVPVPAEARAVGIVPPPAGSAFNANLNIDLDQARRIGGGR